jgi:hypothetical protein
MTEKVKAGFKTGEPFLKSVLKRSPPDISSKENCVYKRSLLGLLSALKEILLRHLGWGSSNQLLPNG